MTTGGERQASILIIDDNLHNLKLAMEYLRAYSFNLLIARDGLSGIERARLVQPDLILLDVQMPNIDGFETCRRLKANPATAAIPVILMTVLSETPFKVQGLEAGAVDYLTKPIEETELLARVNTHLRLRALQEQLRQANEHLEERVAERTAALQDEIAQRLRYQEEKESLLGLVRQQSEQLRQLTQLLLEDHERQQGRLSSSHQEIDRDLVVLESRLVHVQQLLSERKQLPQMVDLALQTTNAALELLRQAREHSEHMSSELQQASPSHLRAQNNPLLKLSDREYEVLQLLTQGKSNAEITELLSLAKTTVSTYQRRIMEKLGVDDPAELGRFVD